MQIERNEIRVFSAVVSEGGFSAAAERLHLSQSAVSQTIANLEHKLEVVLIKRGRVSQPTEAGLRLFRYAQTVINEESSALEDIQQIRSGALSTLSLAMNSMVNRFYGKALMLSFCEANPLTRLKLDVAPSREIIYGVDGDRWELGFGPFQHRMPGHFVARPFFTENRVLVVHETHKLRPALERDPYGTLSGVPLLTSYLDEAARRSGEGSLRNAFANIWEVSHLELRLALTEAAMGVTYISDRLLAELEGFVPIEGVEFSRIERQVGIYYQKARPLSEGARRFLAIAEAHFAASESAAGD